MVRDELIMIYLSLSLVSSSHFSLTTFSVSILQFLLSVFSIFSHSFYVTFIMQSPIASGISLPLSEHVFALPVFISLSSYMSSPCTSHQFHSTFRHFNLHSHFIHSSLISSFNSHVYSYQVVFRKTAFVLR